MRSDSRLDLFAKSLALVLLGLLGAMGALVDYWSAPADVPLVSSASARPAQRTPELKASLSRIESSIPAPAVVRAVLRRSDPIQPAITFVDDRAVDGDEEPVPAPVTLPASLPVPVEAMALRGPVVELSAPPSVARPIAPSAVALADPSADGFFSGMLKKTSSSVSNSLGKASTSLVGAVRAVGDVVKKAF